MQNETNGKRKLNEMRKNLKKNMVLFNKKSTKNENIN